MLSEYQPKTFHKLKNMKGTNIKLKATTISKNYMTKTLFFILIFIAVHSFYSQNIDPQKLNDDISNYNDNYQYQKSIIKLLKDVSGRPRRI